MDQFVFVPANGDLATLDRFASVCRVGGWRLHHNARNSRSIRCGEQEVGCILGDAFELSENRTALSSPLRVDWPTHASPSQVMDYLHDTIVGSYVAFVIVGADEWVIMDPFGSYPCVFDTESNLVASTAAAAFDSKTYWDRYDQSVMQDTNLRADDWLPSGLTAHRNLRRLLPNHGLDCRSLVARRLWPTAPTQLADRPPLARVISRMQRSCAGAAELPGRVHLPLTAGYDSRTAMAVARNLAKPVVAFTLRTTNSIDVYTARRLAQAAGMAHETLELIRAPAADQERWLYRNGHCVGGVNLLTHPSVGVLPTPSTLLSGAGGETARGFYWTPQDRPEHSITPRDLLLRMKLKPIQPFLEVTRQWLESLQGHDFLTILDLAYVEQRMGAWGSPERYSQMHHPVGISPFCDRDFVRYCLASPVEVRRTKLLQHELIKEAWPELADIPFNTYGDWRDLTLLLPKLKPAKVIRKTRQLLGRSLVKRG